MYRLPNYPWYVVSQSVRSHSSYIQLGAAVLCCSPTLATNGLNGSLTLRWVAHGLRNLRARQRIICYESNSCIYETADKLSVTISASMTQAFWFACVLSTFLVLSVSGLRDVNISISADAIDSAGQVYTKTGFLSLREQTNISTSELKHILPKAQTLCPNCPLAFHIYVTLPPTANITQQKGAIMAVNNAPINVTAIPANNGSPISLFVLGIDASFGLAFTSQPQASGDYIKANISNFDFKLNVASSNVGILPAAAIAILDPLVNGFLKNVAIPMFNKDFKGFPLPSLPNVNITDALITTVDGHVSVGLDIDIKQTQSSSTFMDALIARRRTMGAQTDDNVKHLPPGFTGPGLAVSVGGAGLTKILNAFVPQIVEAVNNITIPSMSGKADKIEYEIDSIKLSGFAISSSSIKFIPGRGLSLALSGLSLNVPWTHFRLSKKILFTHAHCSGHLGGQLLNTATNLGVNITANEAGKPSLSATSSWQWGELKVNEKMDHTICKVIQDIASWFVGNIDHKIEELIRSKIPVVLEELVNKMGNKLLNSLVLSKRIDKWALVEFYLTQSPQFLSDTMTIDMAGEFVPNPPSTNAEDSCNVESRTQCDADSRCVYCVGGWANMHGCYTLNAAKRLPTGMFSCSG